MQLINKMHMNYIFPNLVFQNFRMIIFHDQKTLFIKFYNYFCFFATLYFNKNICKVSIFLFVFFFDWLQKHKPEVFCKKIVLKNLANLTEKHLQWSLLIKLQAWRSATLLKKETPSQLFSCEYHKNFKKNILHGTPPVAASENGWRISEIF